jgi:catechol 2,3-dioxygenase-like lactoylglutathione lyase family enzyme
MIKIVDFSHVSITITNLEKSKDFYGRILGLKEIARPDFDFPGAWYGFGPYQLHLILPKPGSNSIHTAKTTVEGFQQETEPYLRDDHHIAFIIENYEETKKILESEGVPFREGRNAKLGLRQLFCWDPDGHLVELGIYDR